MSNFLKDMVKIRLQRLTVHELMHYANEYGFSLSSEEAHQIIHYIRTNDFDIFSKEAIDNAHQKIAEITDHTTADKARNLFEQIISSYGLEGYFK